MKKSVLMLILVVMSGLASGQSLDLRGLTKEQVAELGARAVEMKSPVGQAEGISSAVRKETEAWASLGANIGTAMVSAAREVGVAANEFSQTGLGKVVTGIVVYKVMGRDILKVVFGSIVLLFGLGGAVWVLRTKLFGEVKYEYRPMLWGLWQRQVVTEYKISNDAAFEKTVLSVILIVISLLVGLNCIF